jgi:ABC-2 type transport system ATP-binding protein
MGHMMNPGTQPTPIEVRGLNKIYGSILAIDQMSFDLGEAELLAVAGPDGAGKTSLFRSICGLIDFTEGEITVAGYDVRTDFEAIKPLLGYMPQNFSLYPDLSVEENLAFYGGLFGMSRKEFRRKRERLYEFSGLGPFRDRRAQNLSGGMKQKLALSCNLIHNPKVLVLDEPTTGVDPLSRRQFWDILGDLRAEGASIVVSTAYMDEVARADRAIFMNRGRLLAEGTPDELVDRYKGRVFEAPAEVTSAEMRRLEIAGVRAGRFGATLHVYTHEMADRGSVAEVLKRAGIVTGSIKEIDPGLEDVFIQLMGAEPGNENSGADHGGHGGKSEGPGGEVGGNLPQGDSDEAVGKEGGWQERGND